MAADVNAAPGTAGVPPNARFCREGEAPAELPYSVAGVCDPGPASHRPATEEWAARREPRPPICVLFALEREAAPFRKLVRGWPQVAVHVSGVGRDRARETAERLLVPPFPYLVIAAGFCGALVTNLKVGDIVRSPRILTVDDLVADPAEKRRLAEQHEADAVDMESAAIAEVCREKGVPFLAVRAVSDTADTALSPELTRLLSGGNVSPWKATAALVRRPSLLGEFRRLARDTSRAARNLAAELVKFIGERPA